MRTLAQKQRSAPQTESAESAGLSRDRVESHGEFRPLFSPQRAGGNPPVPPGGRLQRSAFDHRRANNEVPPIVYDVLGSPGQPLDPATRAFFEPRFGHDFSRVRIHTDAQAVRSAERVGALAYTVGNDVVFGAGRFAPGSAAGKKLLAHELTHAVQQSSGPSGLQRRLSVTPPNDACEIEAERASSAVLHGTSLPSISRQISPAMLVRDPDPVQQATEEEGREIVRMAARWLTGLVSQIETMRHLAALSLATTTGAAAASRAFHQHLNQAALGRLLNNAVSVFEAQRSHDPRINFPDESPEQTQLGEAYARVIEQFGLAIEEAHANAANLAPDVRETEEREYVRNHQHWLEVNPSAPLAAGIRTTFTQTEVDLSARRHQQVSAELTNLVGTIHERDLSGNKAEQLQRIIEDALYRLERDPVSGSVAVRRDTALEATLRPLLDQLRGIQWAITQAVDRLARAERRTRDFVADTAANQTVGDTLQAHFATRDPGYATLLADRFARMARELRGEGSLTVHARNPQDTHCGIGSVGGGFSQTAAYADANSFHFCGDVRVGDDETVSTVIHETVHAVVPNLGARAAVATSDDTPRDRAYAYERIYSRLSTEEALDNAESYSFYIDALLGVPVSRPAVPTDSVTGCTDAEPVYNAIARATYRIRLGAMWADQTASANAGSALPQGIVDIVHEGFPGADATRAQEILTHMRYLASRLEYYIPVECRPATDLEARAGTLVYGHGNAATAGAVRALRYRYSGDALRVCPAWFTSDAAVREDALTSILVLRYRSTVPAADIPGIVRLVRFVQESAHPSVAGRTLAQHQAADAPPAPASGP